MGFIDQVLKGFLGDKNAKDLKEVKKVVAKIKAAESSVENLSDDGLREKTAEFKSKIKAASSTCILLCRPFLQAGRFCMSFFAAFRFLILNSTAHMRQYAAYGRYFLFYSYNLSYTAPACVIAGTGAKPFTASYIKVPAFAYHRLPPPKHAYPPLPGGRSLTAVQRHHVTRHPL